MQHARKHIVIATFGSLGDLHPFLALGSEAQKRGHRVTIATAPFYADTVVSRGFEFAAVGPPVSPQDPVLLDRLMNTIRGPEYLFRTLFLPHVAEMYAQLQTACEGADLLVASEVVLVARSLAEKTGLKWASVILSPISFLSAHDPSVLPPLPWMAATLGWPIAFHRLLLYLTASTFRRWSRPLRDFRISLGLPDDPEALRTGKFQAGLVLAMFSSDFARPQPDWPGGVQQTGFAFYQQPLAAGQRTVQQRIDEFLDGGQAPIVFTLGSAAVHAPGNFFLISAQAAHRLGMRAILIGDPRGFSSPTILTVPYADYARVFPRAAIVVHQGGIGTTAEALRSGRPQIVVPFNFDQPDNAARVERLGVGLKQSRRSWKPRQAHYSLLRLLRDPSFAEKAQEVGNRIRNEDGATTAMDAIETLLT